MIGLGQRIFIRVISIAITVCVCIVMFIPLLVAWIFETAVRDERTR